MAEGRRYAPGNQLDIEQILLEARTRWLRPAEICEILRNYRQFRIAPEPPNKPPSGSLFLFDRKVLRYFRKDGHNWRKKKDGKTVKEAHERLKAGSIDVLHCYYAHGEENENFQRRSYWMLEEDYMHIVLVHYREVKSNKMNFSRARDAEEVISTSQMSSPASSSILNQNQVLSQSTDTMSLNSVQTSEYEDAESDNYQASSRYQSFPELQQSEDRAVASDMDSGLLNTYFSPYVNNQCHPGKQPVMSGLNFVSLNDKDQAKDNYDSTFGLSFGSQKELGLTPREETLEQYPLGLQSGLHRLSVCSTEPAAMRSAPKPESLIPWQHFTDAFNVKEIMDRSQLQEKWQITSDNNSSHLSKWQMDQKLHPDLAYELSGNFQEQKAHPTGLHGAPDPCWGHPELENGHTVEDDLQIKFSDGGGLHLKSDSEENLVLGGNVNYSFTEKQTLVDETKAEGLKKLDSFTRWMNKELGEVDESHVQSRSVDYWDAFDGETAVVDSGISSQAHLDAYLLSPSLSQEQLFSIIDFSPTWAYTNLETKVLITGTFLKSQRDVANCQWSCMFGEVEVPLEVLADGVLRCHAPQHAAGRVPFYITCSNRLACSEVREFEFRVVPDKENLPGNGNNDMLLHIRLGKLLSLGPFHQPIASIDNTKSNISSKISSLLKEDDDDWSQMMELTSEKEFSPGKVKEQLLQKILKEKLHTWLLHKVNEDGKGPNVLDKEGQGVIHLAAALGYDWAIAPTVAAGVSINFRDVNGWTALHWAAFCGRERTVGALISLKAAPGAVTDPSPQFPAGRTPAELASSSGHKGIAGYLAEISLITHLGTLTLKDANGNDVPETSMVNTVGSVSEGVATPTDNGDMPDVSLKDSLTAVCNATQAAARIYQVFRVQSFQKKQLVEYGDDKFGMSDERALSLISIKSHRQGQHDEPVHTAAIRIQNKFRGWKGRKEFLILRQRVVRIQAHVRGHQVRKHYRKIVWSVGIVEKAILRWRRKGCGLRGFRPDALIEGSSRQSGPSKEDDYDFLKEGRKQTEERLQKALARVKSMVQYPEARDQYRRLINVVTEFEETKVLSDMAVDTEQEVGGDVDDLIDLDALLDDDTFMSAAS